MVNQQRVKRKEQGRPKTYQDQSILGLPEYFLEKLKNEGKGHRWVRVTEPNGDYDNKNVGKRVREGWEFVKEDEFNEDDPFLFGVEIGDLGGRARGVVKVGDVALMKHWQEWKEDRQNKMLQKGNALEKAVDDEIQAQKGQGFGAKVLKKESSVQVGPRQVAFED